MITINYSNIQTSNLYFSHLDCTGHKSLQENTTLIERAAKALSAKK